MARRLASCVREVDTVSREGGDEFVVILPDLERPENARVVADKILREFARPVEIGGHEIHVTTSIGISHYPNDATDVNHLLKHADSAMYQAKDAGRNTVRFFTNDLNFLLSQAPRGRGAAAQGASRTRSSSCATSRRSTSSRAASSGMEALIRWNDPQKGEIFPKDFISVAEELGLIVPSWASGCSAPPAGQLKAWEAEGIRRRDRLGEHLAAPVHVAQARADAPRDRARGRRRTRAASSSRSPRRW